ncbi:hypothetical protein [Paraburkholderia sartisoli]|uniref:Uncharacterized protein n=1 Tax=Paraburkholderia sartisoli TaxID=83784 RepID=A0A1H4A1Z2_9BURK|nr:hypothetical protein [Paraburkholderia sartisoli]SEA29900.1 hypothetical protein SAMN05192564_101990 [Paraburkholderia sartisoli]
MTTLMIKDLSNAQDLDSKKMSAVRGGFVPFPSNNFVNIMPITFDSSKTAYVKQLNENQLGSQIATGDGSAFLDNVKTISNPYIDSKNTVNM